MPKANPPPTLLKFAGRRDWPLEEGIDDWGLTPEQQESYVEHFRRLLDAKQAWKADVHDYFTLRRFLRARTYDLERATTMWMNYVQWQIEFKTETLLQDFTFKERDAFVAAYPQGYHKLDKVGRPIYIQQLGKIDIAKLKTICSEEDMLKFHIQEYERCRKVILPICSRLAGRHLDQTFGIMDVSGVGLGHLTGETKRLMGLVTKYDQDNYPEMLGHICIINAPFIFKSLWGVVKGFIDPRTQSKIEILGTDYKAALLKWVDQENLPDWLGGTSHGSLLDDIGPWSDAELCKQIGVDVEALRLGKGLVPLPVPGELPASASRRISLAPLKMAPSLKRGSGGGFDAARSSGSASGQATISRRFSGVSHVVADDVARRYAASLAGTISLQHESIPESSASERGPAGKPAAPVEGRVPTLVERIAAIERTVRGAEEVSSHLEQPAAAAANGGSGGGRGGTSTKSAPEGSLLNRVETLEESMQALLEAQTAFAEHQKRQLDELGRAPDPVASSDSCCCIVM